MADCHASICLLYPQISQEDLRTAVMDSAPSKYLCLIVAASALAALAHAGPTNRALDSLGGGHVLRGGSLDSLGGGHVLRQLDPLGGGHVLRGLDSLGGGHILRDVDEEPIRYQPVRYQNKRGLDPLR